MAFLKESDYTVLIRSEIEKIIDATTERSKILTAEKMAIAQMRNHLSGRLDVDAIFIDAPADGEDDLRDQYIVMLAIDITLYHLWTKEGGNNIPKTRELRYNDALKWLQDIQAGAQSDLPLATEDGIEQGLVKIWSASAPEDNTY
ncbi:phage protein Gp36 family protein [Saccharicrinis fermentans]|uniref:Mu-like prophage protein gp36 n=1 Tax=Saccharicrinis fermentans DSM 9555 = JCM 21142 TaxID=869213 RepID=W7YB18_9BACT|nr:phage protein Gp36 family protein [Saccharicrinis fermentans]GAF05587.1 Mu-like prophage protein gp36 [Saccharicrinis fermentans DSM 9555 = JCM 21142]